MSACERIVRRFFDAFEHGEIERMLGFVHPDAEFSPAAPMPGHDDLDGREQIAAWARWAEQKRPVMVGRTDAFRVIDDEHVLVSGRVRVPYSDGGFADRSVVWLIRVVDGKVKRFQACWSLDEARELYERQGRP